MAFLRHLNMKPVDSIFLHGDHSFCRQSSRHFIPPSNIHLGLPSPVGSNPSKPMRQNFPASLSLIPVKCRIHDSTPAVTTSDESNNGGQRRQDEESEGMKKRFWAAVALIIGTAVGPGMLGLPSATIRSGPLPSSIAILLSWVYVISSILLVAELSISAMDEGEVGEVSFTGLATNAFGSQVGAFVAVVYSLLSFSLMVACVSGIGSLILQLFPSSNPLLAHAILPCMLGTVIAFLPFESIDLANRLLCFLMLVSITALVLLGLSFGRSNIMNSFAYASWNPAMILPAIPVTVLTLGFHVITPFICKVAGGTAADAQRAILVGGLVPLLMVLSWNLVVLGLSGTSKMGCSDPIELLLSVNSLALPAVKAFAFSALATSLIGYAVSLPKQLVDTFELIKEFITNGKHKKKKNLICFPLHGKVGFVVYSKNNVGIHGDVYFGGSKLLPSLVKQDSTVAKDIPGSESDARRTATVVSMFLVLGAPVLIASFFPAVFAKAIDFAGIYANCFLFGVLPPLMAWIHRSRRRARSLKSGDINLLLPMGDGFLLVLFSIAFILGLWH